MISIKHNTIFIILFLFFYTSIVAQIPEAETLKYITEISCDEDEITIDEYIEIKINSRSGNKYAEIEIPLNGMSSLSNIQAHIEDKSGEIIRKLKKKDIVVVSDMESFSFYEDSFVKQFSLRHNDYPYTIVYSYQRKAKEFIDIAHWYPILYTTPTLQAVLEISVPFDYPIKIKEQNINLASKTEDKGRQVYKWEESYGALKKNEEFAPYRTMHLPTVKVVPVHFKYGVDGSSGSWEEFGNWKSELNSGISELPQKEINKIASLTKGLKTDKEKIDVLYRYLQEETRYVNISIERGGLKSHSATYVSEKKYGDCKALSNYFKSVLNEVGINAYYTSINAGKKIRPIDLEFPSQQFNHIILYIPLEKDTMWLDCTSDHCMEYLGTFIQNRNALVQNGEHSFIARTPSLAKDDVKTVRRVNTKVNIAGQAESDFNNSYKGKYFEELYSVYNNYDEKAKKEILKEYFVDSDYEVPDNIVYQLMGSQDEIQLSYSSVSPKVYQEYGKDIVIKVLPFYVPKVEMPKHRDYPVQIDYPTYKTDTLSYQIPNGYRLQKLKDDVLIESKYGEYGVQFIHEGNLVKVIKSFYLKAGNYPLEEYDLFYDFMKSIRKSEQKLMIPMTK